jgi:hypothetical protein
VPEQRSWELRSCEQKTNKERKKSWKRAEELVFIVWLGFQMRMFKESSGELQKATEI